MAEFSAFGTIVRIGNEPIKPVTNVVLVSGTTYRYTVASHGYSNGNTVAVFGVKPSGYDFGSSVISNVLTNTFDVNIGANPAAFDAPGWAHRADTFAAIVQCRSITGPGLALDTVDVTTHDSPGAYREFVAGLLDGGEFTLDLVFDPDAATHQAIRTDLAGRTRRVFQIVFPDATSTTWVVPALVTQFEPDAPVDGELSASVTCQVVNAPNLA